MTKIVLIGITLISLLPFHESSWNNLDTGNNSQNQFEEVQNLVSNPEYGEVGDDCTVSTHGYAYIDGAAVYFELSVSGPCDSSLADKVRAAIRALRGIK